MNAAISVARAGQELGAWCAADIEKMIQAGVLTPADHFWQEGMSEWSTLEYFVPARSFKPRKAVIQAADAATAETISDELPGNLLSTVPATPRITALAGSIETPGPAQTGIGQRRRRILPTVCIIVAVLCGLMALSGTLDYFQMKRKYDRFNAAYHSPGGVSEGLLHEILTDSNAASLGAIPDLATLENRLLGQTNAALVLALLGGSITVAAVIGYRATATKSSRLSSPASSGSPRRTAMAGGLVVVVVVALNTGLAVSRSKRDPRQTQARPSRAAYEQLLAQTHATLGLDGTIVIEDPNGATLSLTVDYWRDVDHRPSIPFHYEFKSHYDKIAILPKDDPRNNQGSRPEDLQV